MVYLYSGFSEAFERNLAPFVAGLDPETPIALLLQGGPGYEHYLRDYYEPFEALGYGNLVPIAPPGEGEGLAQAQLDLLRGAGAVFIGGGHTPRYAELYCAGPARDLLVGIHGAGRPIAGLSAGAIIMASRVRTEGGLVEGLGLIGNMWIYPHFEEEDYGFRLLRDSFALASNEAAYGIETGAYLRVDPAGGVEKGGQGQVYRARRDGEARVELSLL